MANTYLVKELIKKLILGQALAEIVEDNERDIARLKKTLEDEEAKKQ